MLGFMNCSSRNAFCEISDGIPAEIFVKIISSESIPRFSIMQKSLLEKKNSQILVFDISPIITHIVIMIWMLIFFFDQLRIVTDQNHEPPSPN